MNKLLVILPLIALYSLCVRADFSNSQMTVHPRFPGGNPFIIEISGTWPTDCHPGEQKPVVESYDGQTVEIDFETIVVHITCNFTDTDYRVLVDLSQEARNTKPVGSMLDVRVDFGGEVLEQTVDLSCPQGAECEVSTGSGQSFAPGIYIAPGFDNQGLLVARQDDSVSVFPLVYDESGNSEWLFTGNRVVEDSFFARILQPSGGNCFGCEPGDSQPVLAPVGYLSVLAESPGALQVKINDGLFTEYRQLVFGYETFAVGPSGGQTLIDLAGRWGISANRGTDPPLGDLTEFLPGAFDIVLEDIVKAGDGIAPDGQVSYSVESLTGEVLGQLVCNGQTALDGETNVCEYIDPTDAAEPLFLFYQVGADSLSIEYARAVIAVGVAPGGKVVRLD